ncbi:MAG: hypothetical protein GXO04_01925 [Aquificae bacterium]|nr:hypothetical protein [Aquificota bacterium]
MFEYILSLYTGSLFFLIFIASPVLLRTEKNKDIAGHFYGRMLRRFYAIFAPLLLFGALFEPLKGFILLIGLGVNVFISKKLRERKREIGRIEELDVYHPERVAFRRLSYVSLSVLFINFLLASLILITV